jgi:hypothetical protein
MKTLSHILLLSLVLVFPSFGKAYTLQTLETAHTMFRSATNTTMYAEAAQQFEFLVSEEGIRNGQLFYTLGNSWFMAGDLGRAILNYRRAEMYLPNSADVQHNLQAALEMRADLIPEKELHPLAARLLGWHFKTSLTLRWWLFAGCWMVFWAAWLWTLRSPKKEARITAAVSGLLGLALMASLLTDTLGARNAQPGVVIAKEILARKGDGSMYAPAFLEPLHSGTEFQCLEDRGKWWHIRLADGQTCWIPASAAERLSL